MMPARTIQIAVTATVTVLLQLAVVVALAEALRKPVSNWVAAQVELEGNPWRGDKE
jgi:hypothetical protein